MKKRDKQLNKTYSILLRYLTLLVLMTFSLSLIYKIFTPLTINVTVNLLRSLYQISVNGTLIVIDSRTFIQIIPACIAGSAYLLLLILNLTVPMNLKKRINSILLSFLILFALNILRIFFLAILYHNNIPYVDFTHKLFWYVLSTIFVVLIWFLIVRIFSIKEIPVYTDFKFLIKNVKR